MKFFRHFVLLAIISSTLPAICAEKSYDQTENIQNYIKWNDFIVDICVYEQEWDDTDPELPKLYGVLTQRAVVTGVYKGDIKVGTKLEYHYWIENPPKFFGNFRSTVEGELRIFFFSKDSATFKDGKYILEGDGHFSFDRIKGDFSEAFQKELRRNPTLKINSEQDAAANP